MLPAEIARQVRRFQLHGRRLIENGVAGAYRSRFRGRGVELDEVRPYRDGDDVGAIDWNVTARTGELHVKRFVEEREQTVVFVVDVSASCGFGSGEGTKRDLAAELCGVLALAAAANGDRTGLVLFSDRIERYVPPGRGSRHALAIVRHLLAHEAAGRGTDVEAVAAFLLRVVRRRAVVFMASDFEFGRHEHVLRVVSRRHDLVALEISDTYDWRLPDVGLVLLEDAETGEQLLVDTAVLVNEGAGADRRERQALFARARIDHAVFDTGSSYQERLLELLTRRARVREEK